MTLPYPKLSSDFFYTQNKHELYHDLEDSISSVCFPTLSHKTFYSLTNCSYTCLLSVLVVYHHSLLPPLWLLSPQHGKLFPWIFSSWLKYLLSKDPFLTKQPIVVPLMYFFILGLTVYIPLLLFYGLLCCMNQLKLAFSTVDGLLQDSCNQGRLIFSPLCLRYSECEVCIMCYILPLKIELILIVSIPDQFF